MSMASESSQGIMVYFWQVPKNWHTAPRSTKKKKNQNGILPLGAQKWLKVQESTEKSVLSAQKIFQSLKLYFLLSAQK